MAVIRPGVLQQGVARLRGLDSRIVGYIFVLLAAALWGSLGVLYNTLKKDYGVPINAIVFYRAFFAALGLLVYLGLRNRSLLLLPRRHLPLLLGYALIGITVFYSVYGQSTIVNTVAVAAVLMYTAPAFVTLFAWRFWGEQLDTRKLVALMLTFIGCALVAQLYSAAQLNFNWLGLILGLASGLLYATYTIFANQGLRQGLAPLTVVFYAQAFGAVGLLTLVGFDKTGLGGLFAAGSHVEAWLLLVAIGLFNTLAAAGFYVSGLARIETSAASIASTFELLCATIFGFIFLAQSIDIWQALGGALVVAALIILARSKSAPLPIGDLALGQAVGFGNRTLIRQYEHCGKCDRVADSQLTTNRSKLVIALLFIASIGLAPLTIAPRLSVAQQEVADYLQQYGPTVRLVFAGDIMLGRTVDSAMQQYGDDYPFTDISNTIAGADFAVANLESALTTQPTPTRPDGQWINLKGRPQAAKAIARAGFDLVTVANNHALDYGAAGLNDTVAALDAAELKHIGTTNQPIIVTIKGLRLAFLGYDCVNTSASPTGTQLAALACSGDQLAATEARVKTDIQRAKAQADAVIVFMHWGVEYAPAPYDYQRELARSMADAGATLIVGCHPHIGQGMERIGSTLVAYSLGNFVFDQRQPLAAQTGLLLDVQIDHNGISFATLRPLNTYLKASLLSDSDPHAISAIAAAAQSSGAEMQWQTVTPLTPRSFGVDPRTAPSVTPTLGLAYWRTQQPSGFFADLKGDGLTELVSYRPSGGASTYGSVSVSEPLRRGPFQWWQGDTALAANRGEQPVTPSDNWQSYALSEAQMQVRQLALIPRFGSRPVVAFDFWQPDYRWGGNGKLKNQICIYGWGWQVSKAQWKQLWCGRPLPTVAQRISFVDDGSDASPLAVLWGDDPAQATMTLWSWNGFGYSQEWQSATSGYTQLIADGVAHRFLYR